jgi:hypothetical protein
MFPNFSVAFVSKTWPYKTKDGFKDTNDAMRMAGFPE